MLSTNIEFSDYLVYLDQYPITNKGVGLLVLFIGPMNLYNMLMKGFRVCISNVCPTYEDPILPTSYLF